MSVKELRKRATEGRRATCPACGKNVALLEITSGHHVANDCAPFKQSALDANNPRLQERLKKELALLLKAKENTVPAANATVGLFIPRESEETLAEKRP